MDLVGSFPEGLETLVNTMNTIRIQYTNFFQAQDSLSQGIEPNIIEEQRIARARLLGFNQLDLQDTQSTYFKDLLKKVNSVHSSITDLANHADQLIDQTQDEEQLNEFASGINFVATDTTQSGTQFEQGITFHMDRYRSRIDINEQPDQAPIQIASQTGQIRERDDGKFKLQMTNVQPTSKLNLLAKSIARLQKTKPTYVPARVQTITKTWIKNFILNRFQFVQGQHVLELPRINNMYPEFVFDQIQFGEEEAPTVLYFLQIDALVVIRPGHEQPFLLGIGGNLVSVQTPEALFQRVNEMLFEHRRRFSSFVSAPIQEAVHNNMQEVDFEILFQMSSRNPNQWQIEPINEEETKTIEPESTEQSMKESDEQSLLSSVQNLENFVVPQFENLVSSDYQNLLHIRSSGIQQIEEVKQSINAQRPRVAEGGRGGGDDDGDDEDEDGEDEQDDDQGQPEEEKDEDMQDDPPQPPLPNPIVPVGINQQGRQILNYFKYVLISLGIALTGKGAFDKLWNKWKTQQEKVDSTQLQEMGRQPKRSGFQAILRENQGLNNLKVLAASFVFSQTVDTFNAKILEGTTQVSNVSPYQQWQFMLTGDSPLIGLIAQTCLDNGEVSISMLKSAGVDFDKIQQVANKIQILTGQTLEDFCTNVVIDLRYKQLDYNGALKLTDQNLYTNKLSESQLQVLSLFTDQLDILKMSGQEQEGFNWNQILIETFIGTAPMIVSFMYRKFVRISTNNVRPQLPYDVVIGETASDITTQISNYSEFMDEIMGTELGKELMQQPLMIEQGIEMASQNSVLTYIMEQLQTSGYSIEIIGASLSFMLASIGMFQLKSQYEVTSSLQNHLNQYLQKFNSLATFISSQFLDTLSPQISFSQTQKFVPQNGMNQLVVKTSDFDILNPFNPVLDKKIQFLQHADFSKDTFDYLILNQNVHEMTQAMHQLFKLEDGSFMPIPLEIVLPSGDVYLSYLQTDPQFYIRQGTDSMRNIFFFFRAIIYQGKEFPLTQQQIKTNTSFSFDRKTSERVPEATAVLRLHSQVSNKNITDFITDVFSFNWYDMQQQRLSNPFQKGTFNYIPSQLVTTQRAENQQLIVDQLTMKGMSEDDLIYLGKHILVSKNQFETSAFQPRTLDESVGVVNKYVTSYKSPIAQTYHVSQTFGGQMASLLEGFDVAKFLDPKFLDLAKSKIEQFLQENLQQQPEQAQAAGDNEDPNDNNNRLKKEYETFAYLAARKTLRIRMLVGFLNFLLHPQQVKRQTTIFMSLGQFENQLALKQLSPEEQDRVRQNVQRDREIFLNELATWLANLLTVGIIGWDFFGNDQQSEFSGNLQSIRQRVEGIMEQPEYRESRIRFSNGVPDTNATRSYRQISTNLFTDIFTSENVSPEFVDAVRQLNERDISLDELLIQLTSENRVFRIGPQQFEEELENFQQALLQGTHGLGTPWGQQEVQEQEPEEGQERKKEDKKEEKEEEKDEPAIVQVPPQWADPELQVTSGILQQTISNLADSVQINGRIRDQVVKKSIKEVRKKEKAFKQVMLVDDDEAAEEVRLLNQRLSQQLDGQVSQQDVAFLTSLPETNRNELPPDLQEDIIRQAELSPVGFLESITDIVGEYMQIDQMYLLNALPRIQNIGPLFNAIADRIGLSNETLFIILQRIIIQSETYNALKTNQKKTQQQVAMQRRLSPQFEGKMTDVQQALITKLGETFSGANAQRISVDQNGNGPDIVQWQRIVDFVNEYHPLNEEQLRELRQLFRRNGRLTIHQVVTFILQQQGANPMDSQRYEQYQDNVRQLARELGDIRRQNYRYYIDEVREMFPYERDPEVVMPTIEQMREMYGLETVVLSESLEQEQEQYEQSEQPSINDPPFQFRGFEPAQMEEEQQAPKSESDKKQEDKQQEKQEKKIEEEKEEEKEQEEKKEEDEIPSEPQPGATGSVTETEHDQRSAVPSTQNYESQSQFAQSQRDLERSLLSLNEQDEEGEDELNQHVDHLDGRRQTIIEDINQRVDNFFREEREVTTQRMKEKEKKSLQKFLENQAKLERQKQREEKKKENERRKLIAKWRAEKLRDDKRLLKKRAKILLQADRQKKAEQKKQEAEDKRREKQIKQELKNLEKVSKKREEQEQQKKKDEELKTQKENRRILAEMAKLRAQRAAQARKHQNADPGAFALFGDVLPSQREVDLGGGLNEGPVQQQDIGSSEDLSEQKSDRQASEQQLPMPPIPEQPEEMEEEREPKQEGQGLSLPRFFDTVTEQMFDLRGRVQNVRRRPDPSELASSDPVGEADDSSANYDIVEQGTLDGSRLSHFDFSEIDKKLQEEFKKQEEEKKEQEEVRASNQRAADYTRMLREREAVGEIEYVTKIRVFQTQTDPVLYLRGGHRFEFNDVEDISSVDDSVIKEKGELFDDYQARVDEQAKKTRERQQREQEIQKRKEYMGFSETSSERLMWDRQLQYEEELLNEQYPRREWQEQSEHDSVNIKKKRIAKQKEAEERERELQKQAREREREAKLKEEQDKLRKEIIQETKEFEKTDTRPQWMQRRPRKYNNSINIRKMQLYNQKKKEKEKKVNEDYQQRFLESLDPEQRRLYQFKFYLRRVRRRARLLRNKYERRYYDGTPVIDFDFQAHEEHKHRLETDEEYKREFDQRREEAQKFYKFLKLRRLYELEKNYINVKKHGKDYQQNKDDFEKKKAFLQSLRDIKKNTQQTQAEREARQFIRSLRQVRTDITQQQAEQQAQEFAEQTISSLNQGRPSQRNLNFFQNFFRQLDEAVEQNVQEIDNEDELDNNNYKRGDDDDDEDGGGGGGPPGPPGGGPPGRGPPWDNPYERIGDVDSFWWVPVILGTLVAVTGAGYNYVKRVMKTLFGTPHLPTVAIVDNVLDNLTQMKQTDRENNFYKPIFSNSYKGDDITHTFKSPTQIVSFLTNLGNIVVDKHIAAAKRAQVEDINFVVQQQEYFNYLQGDLEKVRQNPQQYLSEDDWNLLTYIYAATDMCSSYLTFETCAKVLTNLSEQNRKSRMTTYISRSFDTDQDQAYMNKEYNKRMYQEKMQINQVHGTSAEHEFLHYAQNSQTYQRLVEQSNFFKYFSDGYFSQLADPLSRNTCANVRATIDLFNQIEEQFDQIPSDVIVRMDVLLQSAEQFSNTDMTNKDSAFIEDLTHIPQEQRTLMLNGQSAFNYFEKQIFDQRTWKRRKQLPYGFKEDYVIPIINSSKLGSSFLESNGVSVENRATQAMEFAHDVIRYSDIWFMTLMETTDDGKFSAIPQVDQQLIMANFQVNLLRPEIIQALSVIDETSYEEVKQIAIDDALRLAITNYVDPSSVTSQQLQKQNSKHTQGVIRMQRNVSSLMNTKELNEKYLSGSEFYTIPKNLDDKITQSLSMPEAKYMFKRAIDQWFENALFVLDAKYQTGYDIDPSTGTVERSVQNQNDSDYNMFILKLQNEFQLKFSNSYLTNLAKAYIRYQDVLKEQGLTYAQGLNFVIAQDVNKDSFMFGTRYQQIESRRNSILPAFGSFAYDEKHVQYFSLLSELDRTKVFSQVQLLGKLRQSVLATDIVTTHDGLSVPGSYITTQYLSDVLLDFSGSQRYELSQKRTPAFFMSSDQVKTEIDVLKQNGNYQELVYFVASELQIKQQQLEECQKSLVSVLDENGGLVFDTKSYNACAQFLQDVEDVADQSFLSTVLKKISANLQIARSQIADALGEEGKDVFQYLKQTQTVFDTLHITSGNLFEPLNLNEPMHDNLEHLTVHTSDQIQQLSASLEEVAKSYFQMNSIQIMTLDVQITTYGQGIINQLNEFADRKLQQDESKTIQEQLLFIDPNIDTSQIMTVSNFLTLCISRYEILSIRVPQTYGTFKEKLLWGLLIGSFQETVADVSTSAIIPVDQAFNQFGTIQQSTKENVFLNEIIGDGTGVLSAVAVKLQKLTTFFKDYMTDNFTVQKKKRDQQRRIEKKSQGAELLQNKIEETRTTVMTQKKRMLSFFDIDLNELPAVRVAHQHLDTSFEILDQLTLLGKKSIDFVVQNTTQLRQMQNSLILYARIIRLGIWILSNQNWVGEPLDMTGYIDNYIQQYVQEAPYNYAQRYPNLTQEQLVELATQHRYSRQVFAERSLRLTSLGYQKFRHAASQSKVIKKVSKPFIDQQSYDMSVLGQLSLIFSIDDNGGQNMYLGLQNYMTYSQQALVNTVFIMDQHDGAYVDQRAFARVLTKEYGHIGVMREFNHEKFKGRKDMFDVIDDVNRNRYGLEVRQLPGQVLQSIDNHTAEQRGRSLEYYKKQYVGAQYFAKKTNQKQMETEKQSKNAFQKHYGQTINPTSTDSGSFLTDSVPVFIGGDGAHKDKYYDQNEETFKNAKGGSGGSFGFRSRKQNQDYHDNGFRVSKQANSYIYDKLRKKFRKKKKKKRKNKKKRDKKQEDKQQEKENQENKKGDTAEQVNERQQDDRVPE